MGEPTVPAPRGRGARFNPPNRFEANHHELELEQVEDDDDYLDALSRPGTEYLADQSRSVVAENDSPDVGFDVSLNPYRGCEHGCIYCYARPTHEYLGFSAGLDFETRIMVKHDAPELLRKALSSPRWRPRVLALSGVTDAYQPVERRLGLTRRCLAVLTEYRQPVSIITKNRLVTRDLDLLGELASHGAAGVFLSITSLDDELAGRLEPRTTRPAGRLKAISTLAAAGIPVGVMVAPVIPGLTEHELAAVLDAAAHAGAQFAGYTLLRLPMAVEGLFQDWLTHQFPDRKDKVLDRIRATRGGRLNDSRFGVRMSGEGSAADMIGQVFRVHCRQFGFNQRPWPVSAAAFRRPCVPGQGQQLQLFE
ncbi:MAG: PA0069 family radical SAM protein [Isosphaerales bacterium]